MTSPSPPSPNDGIPSDFNALQETLHFLRRSYLTIILVSALLLVPCVWHKHVMSCDLASHSYNAWLTSLIERGQAPSLYFSSQWSNILGDVLLARFGTIFGFALGEKVVVCASVLLFFWGSFALAAAASL